VKWLGVFCICAAALISASHQLQFVAAIMPTAREVLIAAVMLISCVGGMYGAWAEVGHDRDDALRPAQHDVESLVAFRTQSLCEQVMALEQARVAAVEANAAKSRFLATMSHELRTPLNAILGFSEIISREMYGSAGDPRYPEYARHIYDSGTHLLSLIRDILDLSKIEAGKMELQREYLDVRALVDEARQLSNADHDHAVAVRVAQGLPTLFADHRSAKQMLLNLLSNAMKFTEPGRVIEIAAVQRADRGITISVRDSGVGIAKEDIPKALAPYSQVNALEHRHEGTGLGLPIVNALMKLHGGSLALESEVGQGTTVSLHFAPAVALAAAA
jgi:signal transduction histidine kinase